MKKEEGYSNDNIYQTRDMEIGMYAGRRRIWIVVVVIGTNTSAKYIPKISRRKD